MLRRDFLKLLGIGVSAAALEQAIPLGRVWSFPKKIAIAPSLRSLEPIWYTPGNLPLFRVGDFIRIREGVYRIDSHTHDRGMIGVTPISAL